MNLVINKTEQDQIDMAGLNDVIPASLVDLNIEHTLDVAGDIINTLELIVKKLRHSGKITIHGTDILEVTRGLVCGYLPYDAGIKLLYENKKETTSLEVLITSLEGLGFQIVQKRCNNYKYFVEAKRL